MNQVISSLLEEYQLATQEDFEHALREILQHLALLGLWRSRFYEHAAFYGGTALRIFHGLGRFSEDLDFSLIKPDEGFDLRPYLRAVKEELGVQGISVTVGKKERARPTAIESGFVKANTREILLTLKAPSRIVERLHRQQSLRIRIELDIDPPRGAQYDVRTVLQPIPFQVRLFSLEDLFAGKLHAVLCRQWKSRVKGRDFYDFVWFIGKKVPCHLHHLQARMEQTGHWKESRSLDREALVRLLKSKFAAVDIDAARTEVRPFLRDSDSLMLWSKGLFAALADQVLAI
jgi:predicted nucleotidyltransferase component of viral defense system